MVGIPGVLVPLAFLVWWNRQINIAVEREDEEWNDKLEKATQ